MNEEADFFKSFCSNQQMNMEKSFFFEHLFLQYTEKKLLVQIKFKIMIVYISLKNQKKEDDL